MIKTKQDLKEYMAADNSWDRHKSWKEKIIYAFTSPTGYLLRKYLRFLRKHEYYFNNSAGSRFNTYMGYYYERRKNRLGEKLGIEIGPNCFGKGLQIWHGGCLIIDVKVGENCTLHGKNCIGNNGISGQTPILGDNVDVGYGAAIIGSITIADNTKIGANAVVTKSITEPGGTYVGVPARRISTN